ncbi:hypothetical protein L9F63_012814, partial [Diploptera punctata]
GQIWSYVSGGVKRRHSWSSDSDFQLPERLLASEDQQSPSTWYIQELVMWKQDGVWLAVPDLVGPCRDLDDADLSGSAGEEEEEEEEEEQDMGQRASSLLAPRTRPKLSLTWVLRGDRQNTAPSAADENLPSSTIINTNINNIEKSSIKYNCKNSNNNNNNAKLNTESNNNISNNNNNNNNNNKSLGTISSPPTRTLSEPSLLIANSESGRSGRSNREKHRHRRTRTPRHKTDKQKRTRFGYEIQDVDAFLTK